MLANHQLETQLLQRLNLRSKALITVKPVKFNQVLHLQWLGSLKEKELVLEILLQLELKYKPKNTDLLHKFKHNKILLHLKDRFNNNSNNNNSNNSSNNNNRNNKLQKSKSA